MPKTRPTGVDEGAKAAKRRVRRLERRLAAANEAVEKRTRKVDEAREAGAPRREQRRRAQRLDKARRRGEALAARLATLDPAPPAVVAPGVRSYCLRDRMTVVIVDPVPTVMRNGRPAMTGTCPSCGGRLTRPS